MEHRETDSRMLERTWHGTAWKCTDRGSAPVSVVTPSPTLCNTLCNILSDLLYLCCTYAGLDSSLNYPGRIVSAARYASNIATTALSQQNGQCRDMLALLREYVNTSSVD